MREMAGDALELVAAYKDIAPAGKLRGWRKAVRYAISMGFRLQLPASSHFLRIFHKEWRLLRKIG
jgi:hypothetical protein